MTRRGDSAIFVASENSANVLKPTSCAASWRKRENLVDERAVVPAAGVRPLVRGARDPGAVVLLAQCGRFGVRHDGLIGRRVEPQAPALEAALGRQRGRAVEHELRQPRERRAIGLAMLEGVRRVHDVLLELRLLCGELLHDLAEPLLRRSRQRDAAEPEVAQRVVDELPLDGLRRRRRSPAAC